MVVNEVTRARPRRDKALATEPPAPLKAEESSESSRAYHRSVDQCSARREAYVTVDALKNFMSTMFGVII